MRGIDLSISDGHITSYLLVSHVSLFRAIMFPCLLAKSDGNEPVIIALCNRIFVLNQAMANSLEPSEEGIGREQSGVSNCPWLAPILPGLDDVEFHCALSLCGCVYGFISVLGRHTSPPCRFSGAYSSFLPLSYPMPKLRHTGPTNILSEEF